MLKLRFHLDAITILQMLKGALPPVIVLSIYQATPVAQIEFTVGYLAAILAVSAQCLLPRAKFMKIASFSIISVCGAAALSCLVVVCSVKARLHTTSINAEQSEKDGYNSSASVVSAIWLVICIWLSNTLRAHRPVELQDPMVAFSIFCVVAMTHTPSFTSISEGLIFVRRLLETFLIGLAIAAAVSLFVLPMTSRQNVFEALRSYPRALDEFFLAQITFVQKEKNRPQLEVSANQGTESQTKGTLHESSKAAISSAYDTLQRLQSKIDAERAYTKIEMDWGRLSEEDLNVLASPLQLLNVSLAGLAMIPDAFSGTAEKGLPQETFDGTTITEDCPVDVDAKHRSWETLMISLEERLRSTGALAASGFSLALDLLEVPTSRYSTLRPSKVSSDVEKQVDEAAKACPNGMATFCERLAVYKQHRLELHNIWRPHFSTSSPADADTLRTFVFVEHLQNKVLQAINNLVQCAKLRSEDGFTRRTRFICPTFRGMNPVPPAAQNHFLRSRTSRTNLPAVRSPRAMDAEHMPPANRFEQIGEFAGTITRVFTSNESKFGARVALASFSVAILAYLRQTEEFFDAQRLIWAMIVIVIGMKPQRGASIFGYFARVVGTVVAVVLSFVVWYITNGHVAGVLVFLYIANMFEYYFWIRYPQLLGPVTISAVTLNVIIGYELQVKKLGIEIATSNGQPYYPLYIFGPYKLLCVLAGVTISYFWTVFPSPTSTRSEIRLALGHGLFLLANTYNSMHTCVKLWIRDEQDKEGDTMSSGRRAAAETHSLFTQQMALLNKIQSMNHWAAYDLQLGGKFPHAIYHSASSNMRALATCMALVADTTRDVDLFTLVDSTNAEKEATHPGMRWAHKLTEAASSPAFDSHKMTSVLCHLAGSISNNTALPPYVSAPEPFPLLRKLREVDAEAMRIENVQDLTFAAFACMETITALANSRLIALVDNVRNLVGEIAFDLDDQEKRK